MFEQHTPIEIPNQETDREAWLAWRKGGIGGSDAATILGENKYATPLDLFIDKTTEHVTDESNLACSRGIAMEPLVAERYTLETGRKLRKQKSRVHPDHDYIRCSQDYQILAGEDHSTAMLECKTANSWVFSDMKMNGIHTAYWIQVQHNLMVLDYKWGAIAILQPDSWEFLHFDIERDDVFCAMLLQKEIEFWKLVENGTPPLMETPKLPTLPVVGGELVAVDSLATDAIVQYKALTHALDVSNDIHDEAKALYDNAKKAAQEWMLENGFDVVEGFGKRVYYKEQAGRKSFDQKALKADHPEIDLTQYQKQGAPFRSFRMYDRPVELIGEGAQS